MNEKRKTGSDIPALQCDRPTVHVPCEFPTAKISVFPILRNNTQLKTCADCENLECRELFRNGKIKGWCRQTRARKGGEDVCSALPIQLSLNFAAV